VHIRQARPDSGQVADPVAVAVGEAARVHLVDRGVPPPFTRRDGAPDTLWVTADTYFAVVESAGVSPAVGEGSSALRLPKCPEQRRIIFPHAPLAQVDDENLAGVHNPAEIE